MRMIKVDTISQATEELKRIGVDEYSLDVMAPKALGRTIKLEQVSTPAANILKQEMLSLGGDAAVARDVITGGVEASDVLLIGTIRQLRGLVDKMKRQPFGLSRIADQLSGLLRDVESPPPHRLACNGHVLDLGSRTHIMGVLNVTPDSFSDGGQFNRIDLAVQRAEIMAEEGADIIDIGGLSTRPGSRPVTPEEEVERILPVVEKVVKRIDIPVSVDSYRSWVVRHALDAGVHMINDISGLTFDPDMATTVSRYQVSVVLMHIKGTPTDMQENPEYCDLISEIFTFLAKATEKAAGAGIGGDRIVIDPGIGFGKTADHNLEILRRLEEFSSLGYPILIGASRKSFIGKILDLPVVDRLEGSLAAVAAAIMNGAHILRVHDVKSTVRLARMVDSIAGKGNGYHYNTQVEQA